MLIEDSSTKRRNLPKRSSTYVGRLTDTDRWDSFQNRANDIFICTPPKCGTTWTQAICANLIFRKVDFGGKITNISPWLDSKIESLETCIGTLESQNHRRFIKTHTPLDGIPYFESCEYLIVYRDPRDVYFSIRHHLQNLLMTPDIPQLASDPREGFKHWVVAPFEPGVGEQRCLEAFTQHFQSFWSYRHLNNFHFFHYADMQKNLSANVREISNVLKIDVSEDDIGEICNAVSFAEMKKNAGVFAPGSGKPIFKSDEAFFNSGRNEQWREILNVGDIQSYKNRINELLSRSEIQWVENGIS